MIIASTLFLIAGIVTFIIGVFSSDGLSMIIVSIAASALAALTLFVGVMRDRKRVAVESAGAAPMPTFTSEAPAIESIPERAESPTASALPPIELPPIDEPEPVEASPFEDEDEGMLAPTETASMRAARVSRERFAPADRAAPPTPAARKAAPKKAAPKKATAKKAAPKRTAAKTTAKKATAKKAAAKKTTAKKAVPKKSAAKSTAKKTTAKKAATKKTTTKKSSPRKS